MPSLNIDLDFHSHPKTTRLIGLLGHSADVYPLRMWSYLGKYHPKDGSFKGYTVAEIEALLGWQGPPGSLVLALEKVGFLDSVDASSNASSIKTKKGAADPKTAEKFFRAHDWLEHQGHIPVFKQRARHAAKERWKKHFKLNNAPSIASSIANSNASSNALAVHSSTVQEIQNQTPVLEKKIEMTLPLILPLSTEANEKSNSNVASPISKEKKPKPADLEIEDLDAIELAVRISGLDYAPLFQKAVRRLGPERLRQAVSQIKSGTLEGGLVNPPAALVALVKTWIGENDQPRFFRPGYARDKPALKIYNPKTGEEKILGDPPAEAK